MSGKQTTALIVCVFLFVTQVFGEKSGQPKKLRCISPAAVSKFVKSEQKVQSQGLLYSQVTPVGNIVVLEANPELLILQNLFDLQNLTVRFHPVSKGRYAHTLEPTNFDGNASKALDLDDDESYELVFKHFQFPFGRNTYDRCYVNSNGTITFETPDTDVPDAANLTPVLPRIAGFFADLNPGASGAILLNETSDKVVVTWFKVPEFFNQNQFDFGQNTFQIVMYKTGVIDLVYTNEFTATQGFVGLIPGLDTIPLRYVDFSSRKSTHRTLHSFVENFHDYISADIPNLMKSLYLSTPDRFDFISLFSNFDLTPVPGAQAFAINVRNNVRGIGNPSDKKPIFKDNEIFGSRKQLQNITFFGNVHQYPSDPSKKLPEGDVSLLDILAHEIGHRWLSYVKLLKNNEESDVLLGRDKTHWSFFFDSDGSFLEGNQIHLRKTNSFETGNPFQRYSDLDLYLMGLNSPEEVRETYYVEGPSSFSPDFPFSAESSPEQNVKFKGTAVPLKIQDIIAANGLRRPNSNGSQKDFRHLFVIVVRAGQLPTPEELAFMELVRASWSDFFFNATAGKASMDTVLEQ
ncbi:hypothetical protein L0222_20545 [bacterium]|nr:hypothetical protein [bacterium]